MGLNFVKKKKKTSTGPERHHTHSSRNLRIEEYNSTTLTPKPDKCRVREATEGTKM
jgi:hypothetical protein